MPRALPNQIDLVSLLGSHQALLLGESHPDPALAFLIADQAHKLYRAGVRHAVLESDRSPTLDRINTGRDLRTIRKPGAYSFSYEDQMLDGHHFLELAIALRAAGIQVHAGDTQWQGVQKLYADARTPAQIAAARASDMYIRNLEMGTTTAAMVDPKVIPQNGSQQPVRKHKPGKVIAVVGLGHLSNLYFPSVPTITEVVREHGVDTASAITVGGIVDNDKVAFPEDRYRSFATNIYGYHGVDHFMHFPETALSKSLFQTFRDEETDANELRVRAAEELGVDDPLVNHLMGYYLCRTNAPFAAARDEFALGAAKGDSRQLLACARMTFLDGDYRGAASYAQQAARAEVPGAMALASGYTAIAFAGRPMPVLVFGGF